MSSFPPFHPVASSPSFENGMLRGSNRLSWNINPKSFRHFALTGTPKLPVFAQSETRLLPCQNLLAPNRWMRSVASVHRLNASLRHSCPSFQFMCIFWAFRSITPSFTSKNFFRFSSCASSGCFATPFKCKLFSPENAQIFTMWKSDGCRVRTGDLRYEGPFG
jgi:hypothetical protein